LLIRIGRGGRSYDSDIDNSVGRSWRFAHLAKPVTLIPLRSPEGKLRLAFIVLLGMHGYNFGGAAVWN